MEKSKWVRVGDDDYAIVDAEGKIVARCHKWSGVWNARLPGLCTEEFISEADAKRWAEGRLG